MEIFTAVHAEYEAAFNLVLESMSVMYVTNITCGYGMIDLVKARNKRFYKRLYSTPNVYPNVLIMFLIDLTRVN
jgi:hypothetical protein